jgi:hypothetical protein
MSSRSQTSRFLRLALGGVLLWVWVGSCFGQVSPAEITDPQLKAVEQTYFPQLQELNREIRSAKFPFPFFLSRYVGLDPGKQLGTDTRGLEFVSFEKRVVLKVTGNYNAAYDGERLTANERAARTFQDVVVPILGLLSREIPADVACDGIGFEVSFHARTRGRNYEYEGKEILVVVFDKADAFAYGRVSSDDERQEILNRSEIYLNGKEFGLALSGREPIDIGARAKAVPGTAPVSPAAASNAGARLATVNPALLPGAARGETSSSAADSQASPAMSAASGSSPPSPATPATPAMAEQLQAQFQAQLDALEKEGVAKFHFVDYAPPFFAVFRNQLVLQVTLRNSLRFDKEASSIYKRAAQSFDLFLAPQLKDLLEKIPADAPFDGLDISLLNQLGADPRGSSEAIEFIFPRKAVRQFVEAEITNQQLIDQSVVLVNGVRITLNLQLVE